MSKGNSGHFTGTNRDKKNFSNFPHNVHSGRQNKHIVGSNNYQEGKSVFSGTLKKAEELIRKYSGTGQSIGENKERIVFQENIGYYADPEGNGLIPTNVGIIHYSKVGAHIVPARPKGGK